MDGAGRPEPLARTPPDRLGVGPQGADMHPPRHALMAQAVGGFRAALIDRVLARHGHGHVHHVADLQSLRLYGGGQVPVQARPFQVLLAPQDGEGLVPCQDVDDLVAADDVQLVDHQGVGVRIPALGDTAGGPQADRRQDLGHALRIGRIAVRPEIGLVVLKQQLNRPGAVGRGRGGNRRRLHPRRRGRILQLVGGGGGARPQGGHDSGHERRGELRHRPPSVRHDRATSPASLERASRSATPRRLHRLAVRSSCASAGTGAGRQRGA